MTRVPPPGEANPSAVPTPAGSSPAEAGVSTPSTTELISQLQADRLWLLRQIDAGSWQQWRLDLAALERELGELLERASQEGGPRG